VLALVGTGAVGMASSDDPSQKTRSTLTLSLLPDSAAFGLDEVKRGAVGFTALIRNEGGATVTVAHPNICFPAEDVPGQTRRREASHGRSEILLTIERPDGEVVVLRAGLLGFFEPGSVDHLVIPPTQTGRFHLGWFFPNARGMWEDDARAGNVFGEEGEYSVGIVFRNAFPRARIRDGATKRPRLVEAWTGEMESEKVTVDVLP
jgi:hypothetical protein